MKLKIDLSNKTELFSLLSFSVTTFTAPLGAIQEAAVQEEGTGRSVII